MSDKDSKIGKVGSTSRSRAVQETEALGRVKGAERIEKIRATQQTDALRSVGRIVSKAEHAQLMKMVDEEADSMFGDSHLSEGKKKLIKDAVRMALDSGLIIAEED